MATLCVAKEFSYKENGVSYYRVYVEYGGRPVPGSRTINVFPEGKALDRVIASTKAGIQNGAWAHKAQQMDQGRRY